MVDELAINSTCWSHSRSSLAWCGTDVGKVFSGSKCPRVMDPLASIGGGNDPDVVGSVRCAGSVPPIPSARTASDENSLLVTISCDGRQRCYVGYAGNDPSGL